MPSSTRDLKRKIKSVNSTKQITNAFELVSTAKLRRARNRMDRSKPFYKVQKDTILDVLGSDKSIKSKYIGKTEAKKPLIVLLTADRGLCGGFNVNVIRHALSIEGDAKFITIGKRGFDHLVKRNHEVVESVLYVSEKPDFLHTHSVSKKVFELYNSGEVDAVYLVYTEFVSTISQVPTTVQLLPLTTEEKEEKEDVAGEVMSYEPSAEVVLNYVIPRFVQSTIFGAMIESSASEQAARRLAMESATESAEEIVYDLTLSLNQARQAAITQEISEIVGGAEALK